MSQKKRNRRNNRKKENEKKEKRKERVRQQRRWKEKETNKERVREICNKNRYCERNESIQFYSILLCEVGFPDGYEN